MLLFVVNILKQPKKARNRFLVKGIICGIII